MKEGVGHDKLEEDDEQIHYFTTNETKEVDIIPDEAIFQTKIAGIDQNILVVDILREEIDKNIFLLLLILHKPGGCPLPEELHEPPLHHHPEQPGDVEENCQEHQVERNPLVVRIINY